MLIIIYVIGWISFVWFGHWNLTNKSCVAYGRAYNRNGDGQVLHDLPLGIDYIKVFTIDLLDVNTFLSISSDEMMTIGDVLILLLRG